MRCSSLPFALLLATTALACSSGDATTGASSTGSSAGTTSSSSTATTGAGGAGGAATTTGGTGGSSTTTTTTTTTGAGGAGGAGPIGGDRPVTVHVPPSYDPSKPTPLVILLHGYTASGALEEAYLQVTPESDKRGFLYAYPDGTIDSTGARFWNATDACCNFYGSSVDDSTYLSQLIEQIKGHYNVDAKRVFLMGHSNGAFMAHRMACEHAGQIAAIAGLAGAMYNDADKCAPTEPVSVLAIHGTLDAVIAYNGGNLGLNPFPSAQTTVADWAAFDKCSGPPDATGAPLDLDLVLLGNETKVLEYKGCAAQSSVKLWSIQLGTHVPTLTPSFIPSVLDFLYAHPKP